MSLVVMMCECSPGEQLARHAFKYRDDPTRLRHFCRVDMMYQCSTGELLTGAADKSYRLATSVLKELRGFWWITAKLYYICSTDRYGRTLSTFTWFFGSINLFKRCKKVLLIKQSLKYGTWSVFLCHIFSTKDLYCMSELFIYIYI